MPNNLQPFQLRNKSITILRKYFETSGLSEAFTPLLVNSGALEPYLDTIRVDYQKYHLPTSPEFSLKKALAFEQKSCPGIYEIAHAFRNESESNLHWPEFTMVEWYRRNCKYTDLKNDVLEIILQISENNGKINSLVSSPIGISFSEMFSTVFREIPTPDWNYDDYRNVAVNNNIIPTERTQETKANKDALGIEIFSVLYDVCIQRFAVKNPGIIFITEFPEFVRGMAALSQTGWAERIEVVLNGVEIANAYQECWNPDELLTMWKKNNEIRVQTGKEEHPIDNALINCSITMKGVSGIALGLERLLMIVYDIPNIRQFYLLSF